MTQRMDRMQQEVTDMAGKLEGNDQGVKTTIDATITNLTDKVNIRGSDIESTRARSGQEGMNVGDHLTRIARELASLRDRVDMIDGWTTPQGGAGAPRFRIGRNDAGRT